jgi:hypothetical protein
MTIADANGGFKPASVLPPPPDGQFLFTLGRLDAVNVSMANLTQFLYGIDNRPVFD